MKKALVVGINHYNHCSQLFGCVDDAHSMSACLERNSDGSVNFGVRLLTGTGPSDLIDRTTLRDNVQSLFNTECETALFFFAGHGYIESTGGYLITSDSQTGHDGIPLSEILTFANNSKATNRIIVLDSCHSGIAGERPDTSQTSELREGITILTASTAEQYATEKNGSGVFTSLFVDALNGAASNLLGDVTPGSVYAHVDQSLGPWDQRPVFKTNVKSFVSLRKVQSPVSITDLQRISEFFPTAGYEFSLDPSYEPEGPNPNDENTAKFSILQKLNRVNLLKPVGAPHMYHAAMNSTACKLTVLGEHYRRLVADGRI